MKLLLAALSPVPGRLGDPAPVTPPYWKRTITVPFLTAVFIFVTIGQLLAAPTFTVTTTADHDDGVCNPADCTLREAINAANQTSRATVQFAQGVTGTILLTGGQLTVSTEMTINGPGAKLLTVDGNLTSRVFDIEPGSSALFVSLSGLTISRGQAPANDARGGCILIRCGVTF